MIIIQAEDGAIVTNPKEIYIDKDLEGHLHISTQTCPVRIGSKL